MKLMIKNFLILNCIGKDDKIGLKVNNNFYIHDFDQNVNNNDRISFKHIKSGKKAQSKSW